MLSPCCPQLSTLSRLQCLCLTHVHVPASDLACLASMPSVTCLRMEHCDALPPGLGHCTWLQRLEVRRRGWPQTVGVGLLLERCWGC